MAARDFEAEVLPELAHHEAYHEAEGEYELPAAAAATIARSALAAVAGESEFESEFESELHPARRWYGDAMLEHLAHEAVAAESEAEAGEAFLPLIPLVAAKLLPMAARAVAPHLARALPQAARVIARLTPQLTRGVVNVARTMYRSPAAQQLLRSVPTIAQRTVAQIARQVAAGRPVTPQSAARMLAGQTALVLRHPARLRRAVVRSRAMDGRFHRVIPNVPAPTAAGVATRPAAVGRCGSCGTCRCCGR